MFDDKFSRISLNEIHFSLNSPTNRDDKVWLKINQHKIHVKKDLSAVFLKNVSAKENCENFECQIHAVEFHWEFFPCYVKANLISTRIRWTVVSTRRKMKKEIVNRKTFCCIKFDSFSDSRRQIAFVESVAEVLTKLHFLLSPLPWRPTWLYETIWTRSISHWAMIVKFPFRFKIIWVSS